MPRPKPTYLYHFTRVEHLPTIVESGLLSDTRAKAAGQLTIEVGNRDIKYRRAQREVGVPPGGVVADYVPFYFAPRSPMMYAIHKGNNPNYSDGTHRLVYLVTTIERLLDLGLDPVLTNRNAVLVLTEFAQLRHGEPPDDFIDWALMRNKYWFNTDVYPDRLERRMEECLVKGSVPWEAFLHVGVRSQHVLEEVENLLPAERRTPRLSVRGNWFF